MAQEEGTSSMVHTAIGAVVLLGVLGALTIGPAGALGFWEPWETGLAVLGRELANAGGSPFAPIVDGALINKPWLQVFLLKMGYGLGDGSEFGFRLPLLALNMLAALVAYLVIARVFNPLRALAAGLLFGITPVVFLSNINLAGEAFAIAPITIAVSLIGLVIAKPDGLRAVWIPLIGAAIGFCLWGRGIVGLAVPLATLAVIAIGARDDEADDTNRLPWLVGGGVLAVASVGYPLSVVMTQGWEVGRDILGLGIATGLPLGVFIAAIPGSRARALIHPIGTPIAAVLMALVIGVPFMSLMSALPVAGAEAGFASRGAEALHFLTYNDFLNGRTLPEHVTFDNFIRFVGYSIYPVAVLVPFGFAYLLQTARPDAEYTDDTDAGARAFKLLLVLWFAVGFGIFGLSATLSGQFVFPLALPLVAPVALALTDRAYLRWIGERRTAFYAAGIAALALLAVTSKDVRGTFNEEMGRPGPHVIFEFLLADGEVAFPAEYTFANINIYFLVWALVLVLMFAQPLRNLRGLGDSLEATPEALEQWGWVGGLIRRFRRSLGLPFVLVGRVAAFFGRLTVRVANALIGLYDRITGGRPAAMLAFAGFLAIALVWTADLTFRDVPEVTNHFSQKGLMETYDELAQDGEPLYTAGIPERDNSYYLGDEGIERLPRVSDLAELFCTSEGRIFVILPTDDLGEAYFHARTHEAEGCDDMTLHVVDARSSRYVLASNELHGDRGEVDNSFVAQNAFTHDSLPEDLVRPEERITADGKLLFIGAQVTPPELGSGEFTVSTYWEVLERVTSNYEMFIHVDFGGNRINGDHDVVHGRWPMRYWVPGDIVRDEYTMEVSRADKRGVYDIWVGFFRGDSRMRVSPRAGDNRIRVGNLGIRSEVDE